MLERLRTALKGSRAYDVWSALRGEQQRRAYVRLMDDFLLDSGGAVNATPLATLREKRRPIYDANGKAHVVAFGSEQWEQYGLWPAFQELGRFTLSHYGDDHAPPGGNESGDAMRARRERGFLQAIDEAERTAPVTCAFFYASGQHVSNGLLVELARRGIWTAMMGLDDKQQLVRPRDPTTNQSHQLRVARQVDLYWTTFRAGVPLIAAAGGRPWYQPEGAHPKYHAAQDRERDLDIVFVGQSYGYRRALVDYLRARGFKVEARGRGWPGGHLTFEQTIELFNRGKVVLGMGGVGHMRSIAHLKGRDFEVPMCGALYLTSYNPELADFYTIGKELLCYSSFEDCVETLSWILRTPDEAQRIRRSGHERALKDHDWRKRVRDMFAMLTGEP